MFFSYFHSYDIVPWKCNTLHLKAYKAKYPLTLDFMNFEWLSKTSVCLFSSCRFLLSSDAAFLRLSIWQKNERIYYWWYWNQNENIGKMVLLNKVTFSLWHFLYSLGNQSFRYKLFRYELEWWNCTKISITSSIVCAWTRKTFWVNILRS